MATFRVAVKTLTNLACPSRRVGAEINLRARLCACCTAARNSPHGT